MPRRSIRLLISARTPVTLTGYPTRSFDNPSCRLGRPDMIRVLGGSKRLCDGLTRRELIQVGTLGMLGLSLPDWQVLSQAQAAGSAPPSTLPGFGRAKACILLFLYGSPSQLETFDPK